MHETQRETERKRENCRDKVSRLRVKVKHLGCRKYERTIIFVKGRGEREAEKGENFEAIEFFLNFVMTMIRGTIRETNLHASTVSTTVPSMMAVNLSPSHPVHFMSIIKRHIKFRVP